MDKENDFRYSRFLSEEPVIKKYCNTKENENEYDSSFGSSINRNSTINDDCFSPQKPTLSHSHDTSLLFNTTTITTMNSTAANSTSMDGFRDSGIQCESNLNSSESSQKRVRFKYTREQLRRFEEIFLFNMFPDSAAREAISKELKIPSKNVQVWFKNRRAKYRKMAANGSIVLPGDEQAFAFMDLSHHNGNYMGSKQFNQNFKIPHVNNTVMPQTAPFYCPNPYNNFWYNNNFPLQNNQNMRQHVSRQLNFHPQKQELNNKGAPHSKGDFSSFPLFVPGNVIQQQHVQKLKITQAPVDLDISKLECDYSIRSDVLPENGKENINFNFGGSKETPYSSYSTDQP